MAGDGKGKMREEREERRTEERERQKIADISGCLHTCWLSHFLTQGLGPLRDGTLVSYVSCLSRRVLYHRATCEALVGCLLCAGH